VVRIDLRLPSESDWIKVFDPRDGTIFATLEEPPALGTSVRVDIVVGREGPRVILRGQVISRRDEGGPGPMGCTVAIGPNEREKINYINGFVRGGLLNLREKRRLPIRLPVTYGGLTGPCQTFTRDLNEEGVFVLADQPLPEDSELHLLMSVPGRGQPLSLVGIVSHTVVPEDEDTPGMGIVFKIDDETRRALIQAIDELERGFLSGSLPEALLQ
jgi:hypothetical protein